MIVMPVAAGLAYDERGSGRAIVFVHGHPFNRSMWRPQLEALGTEFRVIAPDLPGYGDSPVLREKVTMREFADAIVALLDQLEVDRAVVVGLSMGGLVGMELGLGYPERLHGLVLAATTAAPLAAGEAETRRAAADELEANGMLTTALEMTGRLFGPAARRDPAIVGALFETMISANPAGAAAALRGRAERPDYSSLLPSLTVPALVIAGDQDSYAPQAVIDQLVGSLPEPKLVLLAGVGHLPNLEEPGLFNSALRAFAGS